jgi:hypothetical protein
MSAHSGACSVLHDAPRTACRAPIAMAERRLDRQDPTPRPDAPHGHTRSPTSLPGAETALPHTDHAPAAEKDPAPQTVHAALLVAPANEADPSAPSDDGEGLVQQYHLSIDSGSALSAPQPPVLNCLLAHRPLHPLRSTPHAPIVHFLCIPINRPSAHTSISLSSPPLVFALLVATTRFSPSTHLRRPSTSPRCTAYTMPRLLANSHTAGQQQHSSPAAQQYVAHCNS